MIANISFLRVNYYLYKYEFSSKDLKAMFKIAICCMLHVEYWIAKILTPTCS